MSSSSIPHGLIRLKASVQNYDWGKLGSESAVARFAHSGSLLPKIEEEKPYAELWVGTHPNGPATVFDYEKSSIGGKPQSLKQWLEENPAGLGEGDPADGLCFLFKILSIAKALSIQVHPHKARAEELFKLRPDLYKDPNHKPEMACALTEFEAFLGFERIETIVENVNFTPELLALVTVDGGEKGQKAWKDLSNACGSQDETQRKFALRQFFALFMASPQEHVTKRVQELIVRINLRSPASARKKERMSDVDLLAVRLHSQFPNDVGIFCAYVMCYRKLEPGQSVFLAANEPHAYLSGDCVEVMANSDNVIRAALTPKFKDLPELEQCLTYNEPATDPSKAKGLHPCQILSGTPRDDKTLIFSPPDPAVTEFQLERTTLIDDKPYELVVGSYGSVIFVVEGKGEATWDHLQKSPLYAGTTFFLPAGARVTVTGNLILYRCSKKNSI